MSGLNQALLKDMSKDICVHWEKPFQFSAPNNFPLIWSGYLCLFRLKGYEEFFVNCQNPFFKQLKAICETYKSHLLSMLMSITSVCFRSLDLSNVLSGAAPKRL